MAFSYYKSVTADHTQCGTADSTDFPVTIWVTDADLKTVANGGFVTSTSGYDIRPYADSALTSALTFELVAGTYVATTGALEMHVKVPTLSHTTDTVFYLAFGNSSLTTDGSSTSTWNTNFKGVWHLPNGSSLTLADSTVNANTGTNHSATATTGEIDGGANFASSHYIDTGNGASLRPAHLSVSIWANPTTTGNNQALIGYDKTLGQSYMLSIGVLNAGRVEFISYNGGWFTADAAVATITANAWNHLVGTYDGTNMRFYVNAVLKTTTALSSIDYTSNNLVTLGIYYNSGSTANPLTGALDEARVSATADSADWITATYNNQKPSSTFLTFGSRTPVSTGTNSNFLFF